MFTIILGDITKEAVDAIVTCFRLKWEKDEN